MIIEERFQLIKIILISASFVFNFYYCDTNNGTSQKGHSL